MAFLRATRERDLRIDPIRAHSFRAVTHLDISADDVEDALERIGQVV
jgi:threonine aldolase